MNFTNLTAQHKSVPLTSADYIVFASMLLGSTAVGIYFGCFGSRQSTVSKYLMRAKKFKSIPVAASMILCQISSITLIGLPADVYKYGATYLLIPLSMLVVCLVIIYIYLPVFYNLQLTSIYEYLEQRFDFRTRLLGSVVYLVSSFLLLPVAMYTPVLALSKVSGIDINVLVPVICGICIFYTVIGGLKSVIWVDVLQGVLIFISVLTILLVGMLLDEPGAVWFKAKNSGRLHIFDFDFDPTRRNSFWIMTIGTTFFWMSQICTSQSVMQKLLAVPTIADCVIAVILFGTGVVLLQVGSVFIGLFIYAKFSDCDPFISGKISKLDELVPLYVIHIFEKIPGLLGLFFAAALSASLSSLSTYLNCMAGVVYTDILTSSFTQNFSEKTSLITLKLIVLLLGVTGSYSIFIVERLGGVFQLSLSLVDILFGPLSAVFIMGLLNPKFNAKGAYFGALGGLIFIVCIITPAKYYEMNNLIQYPSKLLSTKNCSSLYNAEAALSYNTTFHDKAFSRNGSDTDQPNFIFRISFYYYSLLGFSATLIFGTIVSYLTPKSSRSVDRKLIVPFCHFLLPTDSDKHDYSPGVTDVARRNTEEEEEEEALF